MSRRLTLLAISAALLAAVSASSTTPPGGTTPTADAGPFLPVAGPFTPVSAVSELNATATVTVAPGDTYGRWAVAHCGAFTAWPGIAAVNGWPERRIPVGATAVIACTGVRSVPPAAPPVRAVSGWTHPLASGRQATSCYHTSRRPGHNGVDIPQTAGTPIRAAAAGVVTRRAYQERGAGHYITIGHAGPFWTQYHHLRSQALLPQGAPVYLGQIIGYVGETGNATGPHLHFEVMSDYYGRHVNPGPFMRDRGVDVGC